jgi:hypothetical protein
MGRYTERCDLRRRDAAGCRAGNSDAHSDTDPRTDADSYTDFNADLPTAHFHSCTALYAATCVRVIPDSNGIPRQCNGYANCVCPRRNVIDHPFERAVSH